MQYTAGELAKLLGVSSRTIRFYDEKKLLIHVDIQIQDIVYMMSRVFNVYKK